MCSYIITLQKLVFLQKPISIQKNIFNAKFEKSLVIIFLKFYLHEISGICLEVKISDNSKQKNLCSKFFCSKNVPNKLFSYSVDIEIRKNHLIYNKYRNLFKKKY